VTLALVAGCEVVSEFTRDTAGGTRAEAVYAPRYTVELAPVERADLESRLEVVGSLEGLTEVDVVPDVSGRLEAVHVSLGDRVRVGQPVAQIRSDDILSQVRQAEHAYEVARATLQQREVDLTLSETAQDRSRQLVEEGLIAREEFDDAVARAAVQEAQVALANAQFSQNGARLDELKIVLADATIRSPVDGFVAQRNLDPGAFASTNTTILSVVDIRHVKLVARIVERDFRRVRVGAPTEISVDAYPLEVFTGQVARLAPVLDPVTRTAEVEVEIPNEDFRLKPGMYARVALTADVRSDSLVVPRNAVVDVSGARGVFIVTRDSRDWLAHFVAVETGLQDAERVEIVSGLSEGQQVVSTGAAGLSDGDIVTVLANIPAEPTS
jgi:RND family efflux transporter MFP subunit